MQGTTTMYYVADFFLSAIQIYHILSPESYNIAHIILSAKVRQF